MTCDTILNNNGLLDTRPDLVVESTAFPTKIEPGKTFTTTLMVRNNSMAEARSASRIRYWLSADSLLSANDVQLAADPVAALVPYAYASFRRPLTLPANTTAGRWFLLYQCDADQQVAEWDEANVFARPLCVLSNCNPLSTATGTPEVKTNIRVYPNPASDRLFIEIDEASAGVDIAIFDVTGRLVQRGQASGQVTEWPTDGLAPGVYHMRVAIKSVVKVLILGK